MSSTWKLIERALNEASGKESLLAYIRMAHGDNEADNLAPFLNSMWNSKDLPTLAKHLVGRYSDSRVNAIFDKAFAGFGITGKEPSSKPAVMNRTTGKSLATSKPPKAKKKDAEVDSSAPQYRTPDQAAAQQAATAATAASRPDRMGSKGNNPGRPMVSLKPGEKAVHDVGQSVRGTSPGHTKQPIDQPSVVMQPSKLSGQLKPLEDRALQLKKMITLDLENDPTKKAQLVKAKKDLKRLQQQIDTIKHVGKSGVEAAQRRVDKLSKVLGKTAPHIADDLAMRLGVPTTKQRTRKAIDPETGEEKPTVQVWDQEKVYRFMDKGGVSQGGSLRTEPELEPGVYDPTPAQHPIKPRAMQGKALPVIDTGKGKAATSKPMMKAPKGMDKDGLLALSKLKVQLKRMRDARRDQDELGKVEDQIKQMMSSGGEVIDVVRPGTKTGMRWGDVVWDGTDWTLDSQKVAAAGDAASKPKV